MIFFTRIWFILEVVFAGIGRPDVLKNCLKRHFKISNLSCPFSCNSNNSVEPPMYWPQTKMYGKVIALRISGIKKHPKKWQKPQSNIEGQFAIVAAMAHCRITRGSGLAHQGNGQPTSVLPVGMGCNRPACKSSPCMGFLWKFFIFWLCQRIAADLLLQITSIWWEAASAYHRRARHHSALLLLAHLAIGREWCCRALLKVLQLKKIRIFLHIFIRIACLPVAFVATFVAQLQLLLAAVGHSTWTVVVLQTD